MSFLDTVLEQIFPNGPIDMDFLFSVHYSQSDGFANARYDSDDPSVNENSILAGARGPMHVWSNMLCAFQRGFPKDPDFFQKSFGLLDPVNSASEVPKPLSDEQKKFAKLEFASLASNMIKETGALGQAVRITFLYVIRCGALRLILLCRRSRIPGVTAIIKEGYVWFCIQDIL